MKLPQLIVQMLPGLCLSVFGLWLLRSHRKSWKTQQEELQLDEADLEHFRKRYYRRTQASGMMALIGILMIVGLLFITKDHKLLFGFYWMFVLVLTFWLILLALGDAVSIATYSRSAQTRLNEQRRILEAELERFRAQQGNGHPPNENLNE
jgi:uncharacterized membrane protein YesL